MFVLLFAYVFGGAIPIPGGGNYNDFLMPGIFAQNIVFAAGITAIGIADDIGKGIIDRFRSLPMARSAVLTGRSLSDVVYNLGILIVLMLSGLFVGWRVHEGIPEFLSGVALLLLFAFAMSWLGIYLGLMVPSVEVAQQAIFTVLFPITFLSNVFVPPQTLPDWLQPIAEWNPTSTLTGSLRQLWGNPNPFATDSFPSQNPILVTLVWVVVVIAIFAPLGIRRYRNLSR
jgi:ABC transporter DrrB family efflux protein